MTIMTVGDSCDHDSGNVPDPQLVPCTLATASRGSKLGEMGRQR